MTQRERLAEALAGGGFAVAVALLWLAAPPHGFSVVPAVLAFAALLFAFTIRIDTLYGFTVPTQLAYVPLLFVLPVALAPVAVAAAAAAAFCVEAVSGRVRPSRIGASLSNAWFAIGPAAVFAASGAAPSKAGAGLLVAALAAQFIADFAVSTLRTAIDVGAGIREQLRDLWVYGVDASFACIGLVIAETVHRAPIAALAPVPLLALVAILAASQRTRLRELLRLTEALDPAGKSRNGSGQHTGPISRSVS